MIVIGIGLGISYFFENLFWFLRSFRLPFLPSWDWYTFIVFILVFSLALYFIKKVYSLGLLRNPLSDHLREFKEHKVTHSYSSQLEILSVEIKKMKKEIKKWEDEKREFLLKHAAKIKKPDDGITSETKECPMCAKQ